MAPVISKCWLISPMAATANNMQPWEFVVVADPGMLRRIATTTDYGKFIVDAPACVLVLCRDMKYYLEDGSAATENILLAARAHGLGSCWVAGDKKPNAAEICRLVGSRQGYKLVSLIPIGYPAENPERVIGPFRMSCTGRSTETCVTKSTIAALSPQLVWSLPQLGLGLEWLHSLQNLLLADQSFEGTTYLRLGRYIRFDWNAVVNWLTAG